MAEAKQSELSGVMHRNIDAMLSVRRETDNRKPLSDRIAHAITGFVGTMKFVVLHVVIIALWIVVNVCHVPFISAFDPYPFVILPIAATLEAIFLTALVLITQNHMARIAEQRADLDLQINLLSEHELTKLIQLVDAIAKKVGVPESENVEELKRDVHPTTVLKEMERAGATEKSSPS